MLAGEYAVLRGAHALAATVNQFITVDVTYDPNRFTWEIHSDLWPEAFLLRDQHSPQSEILCDAVQSAARRAGLSGGVVKVTSQIDIKHGLGTSSAIRLGVCAAMQTLRSGVDHQRSSGVSTQAVHDAWALQVAKQGMASGYDIATQYAGGLVEFTYQYEDNHWHPHWFKHQIDALPQIAHIFVGGKGAPTKTTMQSTAAWLDGGNRVERLVDASEALVDAFLNMIRWPTKITLKKLFAAAASQRILFTANPNFPIEVASRLADIPGLDQTWSWKTTGAGGEDAILILGTKDEITLATEALRDIGWYPLNIQFTAKGISIEESNLADTTNSVTPTRSTVIKRQSR